MDSKVCFEHGKIETLFQLVTEKLEHQTELFETLLKQINENITCLKNETEKHDESIQKINESSGLKAIKAWHWVIAIIVNTSLIGVITFFINKMLKVIK